MIADLATLRCARDADRATHGEALASAHRELEAMRAGAAEAARESKRLELVNVEAERVAAAEASGSREALRRAEATAAERASRLVDLQTTLRGPCSLVRPFLQPVPNPTTSPLYPTQLHPPVPDSTTFGLSPYWPMSA